MNCISIQRRDCSRGCCTCAGSSIGQLTGILSRWSNFASTWRIVSGPLQLHPSFAEMMQIEVRLLRESDIPAALRLKELAQWNQTENDWLRLLRLEPNGCFCATIVDREVAPTTTPLYGNELP